MGTKDKLDIRIRQVPKDIRFSEIKKWLNQNDFFIGSQRGSHYVFKREQVRVNITCPHGGTNNKFVQRYQVVQAIQAVDSFL